MPLPRYSILKKCYKIFLTEKAIEIIDKLSKAELEWSRMIYSQIASNEKDAREILKRENGYIKVKSQKNKGSEFILYLWRG